MIWLLIESTCRHEQAETIIAYRDVEHGPGGIRALEAEVNAQLDFMYVGMRAWARRYPVPDIAKDSSVWFAWANRGRNACDQVSRGKYLRARMYLERIDHTVRVQVVERDILPIT